MSRQALALLAVTDGWTVADATGQPSAALSLAQVADGRLGHPVGLIVAAAGSTGHRLEAAVPATDLGTFDDLELWIKADHRADGSPSAPWFLELRLGSASRPIGSAGNSWHRFLPVSTSGSWDLVRLSLSDLAEQVRQGVNALRLTCVSGSDPFSCHVDGPWAARATPIADVDQALRDTLHHQVAIGGTPVPFVLEPSTTGVSPPKLAAKQVTARMRTDLSVSGAQRTDYTNSGFSLRPPAMPIELVYQLSVTSDERAAQATLLEFLIRALATAGTLEVAGRRLPITVTDLSAEQLAAGPPGFMVSVLTGVPTAVPATSAIPPFNRIDVEVDSLASA